MLLIDFNTMNLDGGHEVVKPDAHFVRNGLISMKVPRKKQRPVHSSTPSVAAIRASVVQPKTHVFR